MRTVIVGPRPPEIDALIARRRALDIDRHDEVWEGDYHMNPAPRQFHAQLVTELLFAMRMLVNRQTHTVLDGFNIGAEGNFRIPDGGVIARGPDRLYLPTAELIFEVRSPDDETYEKFPHYGAHGVGEVLVVDANTRTIEAYRLVDAAYERTETSAALGVSIADLAARIDWPE